jgi:hypothetical protein
MKNHIKIIYVLLFAVLGCSKTVKQSAKFYEPSFFNQYNQIYIKDSLIFNTLEHIIKIKRVLIDDYNKAQKENPNKIAVRLIIEYEFGGVLTKNITEISTKYSTNLSNKYFLINDCKNLSLDQALFYLTNLENDIIYVYLKSKS